MPPSSQKRKAGTGYPQNTEKKADSAIASEKLFLSRWITSFFRVKNFVTFLFSRKAELLQIRVFSNFIMDAPLVSSAFCGFLLNYI